MGAKTGTKSGRPLKQNGKNKAQEKEETNEGPDYSVLRKPVEISVLGLSEVLKVFQSCTPELRHLLSYECDVIYECKLCRNLFRSLANFISHKRMYCMELHNHSQMNFRNRRVDDSTVFVQPEPVRTTRARESCHNTGTAVDKDQKEVCGSRLRSSHLESVPCRITIKKDLTSIVETLMHKNSSQFNEAIEHVSSASEFYDGVSKELEVRKTEAKDLTVHLEPIDNTSFGVFQTVVQSSGPTSNLIKSQVQDLQKIISDTEVVLGPDGKVIEGNNIPSFNHIFPQDRKRRCKTSEEAEYSGPRVTAPESEVELFCNICKEHFTSFKNLNRHMKSLHTVLRTLYPCPCCKVPFSNSWSVYRHLLKVHRKTNEQIRKLRDKVIKRSYKKEILLAGAQKLSKPNTVENPLCPSEVIYDTTPAPTPLTAEESDKHWFGHEGDGLDMQCCGGCGRRFERRAALLAHSQSCLKLMAAKQSVTGSARPPAQADKSPAIGRPSVQSKLTSSLSSVSASVIPMLWSSSIPVHPLNHTLHLSQEKDTAPAKKIEIQVRKDYGKALTTISEYRTRTPSTSRSEDGAASTGRSDDGMTSGSSETEASGVSSSNQRTGIKPDINSLKHIESRNIDNPEEKKIMASSNDGPISKKESGSQNFSLVLKRGAGRPPKKKVECPHVNGVVSLHTDNSLEDTSDESQDVAKEEAQIRLNILDSRKRKALSELDLDDKIVDMEESSVCSEAESKSDSVLSLKYVEAHKSEMMHAPKWKCLVCQKKYRSLGNLKRHLAKHIGWNRFRCIMCDFRCFSKGDCISHALDEHLESWEKLKAAALVQDMQMDAGGSTDILADSGDSDSIGSDKSMSVEPLDTISSCHDVLNCTNDSNQDSLECFDKSTSSSVVTSLGHDSPAIDDVGEIISVA